MHIIKNNSNIDIFDIFSKFLVLVTMIGLSRSLKRTLLILQPDYLHL